MVKSYKEAKKSKVKNFTQCEIEVLVGEVEAGASYCLTGKMRIPHWRKGDSGAQPP